MSSMTQPLASPAVVKSNPYLNKGFIGVAIVLAVSAAVLNILVFNRDLHFKKLAVPPAMDLKELAPRLGTWVQISKDEPLDSDVQEVLGTDRYIYRDYVDVSAQGGEFAAILLQNLYPDDAKHAQAVHDEYIAANAPDRLKILDRELADQTSDQRKVALAKLQTLHPDAVVNMGLTYYTGLVDTVAHVPDRCYIASGYEPTDDPVEPHWTLPTGRQLQVRFINFEDQSGNSTLSKCVAYFFHVDGAYNCSPIGVRLSLQNLFYKYGYYAKVELMTVDGDKDRSARTMQSFLGGALPELEKIWPDWDKLVKTSGK